MDCDFPGFSMCDDWTGAAFVQVGDRATIAIVGLKGATNCYYCGDPVDDAECEVEPLPGECDLEATRINGEIAKGQVRGMSRGRTFSQSVDPAHQFLGLKWLYEIVVATRSVASNLVVKSGG